MHLCRCGTRWSPRHCPIPRTCTSLFLRFYVLIDIIPNYLLALYLNIRWPLSNDRRADRHAVHDDRRHAPIHAQITCFSHCQPGDSPTSIMSHQYVIRLLLIVSDRVHSWTTAPVRIQRITTTARCCSMLRLTQPAFGRVSGP